ncbi:MAG TPA: ROK family protein [Microbacteriaceae bacterium]|nr:ROK family protein [Microbacteriaceae bacterium]
MNTAVGVDIGGTGIKAARVDVTTGQLLSERVKLPTPEGGEPETIAATVQEVLSQLGAEPHEPLGVCFPAVVRHGRTMSAANVSKRWIGFEAERFFEAELARPIHFSNDADAAGIAEVRFGAAKGHDGLVLLTTLGTGIGTALLYNGVLVPNSELGHIELKGKDAEKRAAYSAMEREELSWKKWAKRLQRYYAKLEALFSPDLFVVGGGVSKYAEEFLPLLKLNTPIVPAALLNNAGILGAAVLAADENVTPRQHG